MAGLAGGWETGRRVIRIGGSVVVGLMTAITSRWQGRVVVVHVAAGAGHGGVRASQRESRVVVIEAGIGPRGRAVADVAGCREADLRVIGIIRVVVVGLMASDASGVGARQLVVSIHVALLAGQRTMRASQRPPGRGVIEGAIPPVRRGVTLVARGGEPCLDVIRIRGSVVVSLVAVHAGAAGELVIVVDVALRALQRNMRAGQRKTCRCMVERRIGPVGGAVTSLTAGGETGGGMRRIIRGVVVVLVAADASRIGAGQAVITIHVALLALQSGVKTSQRESGG